MTVTSTPPTGIGERLKEARKGRGMSQEEVARELGMSRPTLIAIEQGRRAPQPEELVTFARLYGRQVHELVRDSPPVVGLAAQFRVSDRSDAAEMNMSVNDLQRLADSLVELETITKAPTVRNYPEPYDISGLPIDVAAEQVAEAERRRLGLGDGPLPWLREILEDEVGLRVFAVPLPSKVAGLFGHAEPAGSCIALNARHPRERQQWTLAHEFAHFLTSRWSAEVTAIPGGRQSAGERFADAFAAKFLMPQAGLTRRFQAARRSPDGRFTGGDLLQIASLYSVSAEALALRLEDLRLLTAGWWDGLRSSGLKIDLARAALGIPAPDRDDELLPRRARYLAVEAYLNADLSEGQLAQFLRMDRTASRRLVQELTASTDVDPDGAVVEYAWDPDRTGDAVAG
jgi:Zn-dependent peptidase ImmA (M78 family)/DNA-binding XRE family transcriptional regulator